MAKQLNQQEARINLTFGADASQAKKEINELSKALQEVARLPGKSSTMFDDASIKKASQAALELERHLAKAVNVNTGKLDLSRLASSLKASNKNLNDYYSSLLAVGQEGQQAFLKISSAIASAEMPTTRMNARMSEFLTTLKNTARWQISSSIIHGFQGALQKAYSYAQDLNESLNNIRIVTGASVEDMSDFAKEANKAARALSATTTEYTDAALIYYQQGLSDKEVAERTEATIKMANVSRQSAETVSEQLTAVWNNFDNGTKSLEYYVDVMTALGAETASSSEEIATGLEKFAAVAETVGLSYEYATAALATVTATTRQSADVVGTAFKTLFARIQDLELGETLDDGVTLGKYSEALHAIGINVLDVNGNVRDMNDILDDMGNKWKNISKAQQVSVAQTVAGTRQYTQLIALMDNWDFFQQNINTAMTSEGALDKQAQIYAESWEGARDRVTAAAEDIYQSLINDEFFVDLLDGAEIALGGVKDLIDGFGGLKGILTLVGSFFLQTYAKQMPATLSNLKQNLMVFTGQATKQMEKITDDTEKEVKKQQRNVDPTSATGVQYQAQERVLAMKKQLSKVAKALTKEEYEEYEARIKNVEAMSKETVELAKQADAVKKVLKTTVKKGAAQATSRVTEEFDFYHDLHQEKILQGQKNTKVGQGQGIADNSYLKELKEHYKDLIIEEKTLHELVNANGKLNAKQQEQLNIAIKKTLNSYAKQNVEISKYQLLSDDVESMVLEWNEQAEAIKDNEEGTKALAQSMQIYIDNLEKSQQYKDLIGDGSSVGVQELIESLNTLKTSLQDNSTNANKLTMEFEDFAATLGMTAQSKVETLTDEIEKLEQALDGKVDPQIFEDIKAMAMETAEKVEDVRRSGANLDNNPKPEHKGGLSEKLTEITGAAMSLYSTFTTLNSAIDTFNDTSADAGDIIGSVVGVAGTAASSISQVTATVEKLGIATGAAAGWIGLAVTALVAVAVAIEKVVITQKEATEAINEANESYTEAKEKTKELKDELENIRDKIEEIKNQGPITFIEQQELNDLREAEALLVSEVALQERLLKLKQQEAAATFSKNYEKSLKGVNDYNSIEFTANAEANNTSGDIRFLWWSIFNSERADMYGDADAQRLAFVNDEERQAQYKTYREGYQSYYDLYKDDPSKQEDLEKMRLGLQEWNKIFYAGEDYNNQFLSSFNNAFADNESVMGTDWQSQILSGETVSADEIANSFSATFTESLEKAGILPSDYAEYIIQKSADFQNELAGWLGTDTVDSLKNILSKEDWNILTQLDLTGDEEVSEILEKIDAHKNNEIVTNFTTNFKETYDITKDLKHGDIISLDDYNTLIENFGTEIEDFFVLTADGEYQLIDLAEKFQKTVNKISLDNVKTQIDNNNKQIEVNNKNIENIRAAAGRSYDDIGKSAYMIRRDDGSGTFNYTQSADQIAFLKAMGKDISTITNGTMVGSPAYYEALALAAGKAKSEFIEMQAASESNNQALIENNEELMRQMAATATSYAELEKYASDFGNESLKEEYAESVYLKQAEALDLNIEEMNIYRQQLLATDKAYAKNIIALNQTVIADKRLQKGVKDLTSSWAENKAILESNTASSIEASTALVNILPAIQNILNIDNDDLLLLPPDFVSTHLDLLQDVVDGAEGAVEKLRNMAAQSILITAAGFDGKLNSAVQNLHDKITAKTAEFKVGKIDDTEFKKSCRELILSAGLTQEETSAYFAALGLNIETTFKKVIAPVLKNGKKAFTQVLFDADGFDVAIDSLFKNGTLGDVGGDSTTTTGTPVAEHARRQQTKYTEGRYKELLDDLDDLQEIADDANRALNRLYGKNKLTQLTALSKAQKDINNNLEAQIKLAKETYLVQDKTAAGNQGFTFDAEGHISNYDKLMSDLYGTLNQYEATMANLQKDGKDTTNIENQIAAQEKKIQDAEAAAAQYEETFEKIEDDTKALQEGKDLIQDYAYQKIETELDIRLELNEDDLTMLERSIEALGDDVFARAEALMLMTGTKYENGKVVNDNKATDYQSIYADNFSILTNGAIQLSNAFKNLEISEADYAEGMKKIRDAAFESADALRDFQKTMETYYADTLAAGDDLYQKYMDFLDAPSRVLSHYDNIVDLTGGEKDYKAKAVIYQGSAKMAENEVNVRQEYYDVLKNQADEQKRQMDEKAAKFGTDSNEYKQAKAEWETAQQYANQAQEDLLSAVEEWAEAVNQVLENEIQMAADELEKALTNGSSFDELNTAMERTRSLQEEWLTTTNQIYETNKMMRTAQQALDKTTNQAAKNKLKSFIDQTKELQDQEKLSEFELKIQQSRYNLLLAEIALKEAQNAKSTVRLQRDSEGNFGYVYTADQDTIKDAEQTFEDAQNALYNLSLDGINEYNEKYFQLQQEMAEKINEVTQDRTISEEERLQKISEIQAHYGEMMSDASYLRAIAATAQSYELMDQFKQGYSVQQQSLMNELAAIDEAYRTGDIKSEAEYEEKIRKAKNDHYNTMTGYSNGFYGNLVQNADDYETEMTGTDSSIAAVSEAWSTEFTKQTGFAESWNTALFGEDGKSGIIGKAGTSWDGVMTGMTTASTEWHDALVGENGDGGYVANISSAYANYQEDIEDINEAVGISNQAVADTVGGDDDSSLTSRMQSLIDIIGINPDGSTVTGATNSLIGISNSYRDILIGPNGDGGLVKDLDDLYKKSSAITDHYQNEMMDAIEDLIEDFDDLAESVQTNIDNLNELNDIDLEDKEYTVTENRVTNDQKNDNNNSNDNNDSDSDGSIVAGGTYTVKEGDTLWGIAKKVYGKGTDWEKLYNKNKDLVDAYVAENPKLKDANPQHGWWIYPGMILQYDTGGYTGEWGPAGKLAMLHEKELVLNAQDTENMLMAVSIIRDLMSVFDFSNLSNLTTPAMSNIDSNTLEQSVKIEASFPGVTDRYEIEEALHNLVNTASQFANRKKI